MTFILRKFSMTLAKYFVYRFACEAIGGNSLGDVPDAADAFNAASDAGIVFW